MAAMTTAMKMNIDAVTKYQTMDHRDIDTELYHSYNHRWELPCNYPVFTMVMLMYHYVEIIWRIIVTPIFVYNIYYYE